MRGVRPRAGRGPGGAVAVLLLLSGAAVAGAARAGEVDLVRLQPPAIGLDAVDPTGASVGRIDGLSVPTEATPRAGRRSRAGFFDGHLLPRLNRQLEPIASLQPQMLPGERLSEHALYRDLTYRANDRAESGTRKAVRDYLLEATPLVRIDRALSRVRRGDDREAGGALEYGLGVSHGRPRVEVRRASGLRLFRLGLGLSGRIDVGVSRTDSDSGRFAASWHLDSGEVQFNWRIGL